MGERHSLQVRIAKEAVETYVLNSYRIKSSEVPPLPVGQNARAGVFVSIKRNGQLRGCIGTVSPVRDSLAEEIIHNAVNSASRDPRFSPLTIDELKDMDITVDVLTPLQPISSLNELDPVNYGVVVSSGGRKGLLLPAIEGVDTVDDQIRICRSKGGIGPDEKIVLHRFEVIRYR